ncbi:MAG: DUF2779 domain-containing protein [Nanoarchaeota archaeon]|nr:DUF2779 domain-containing protein [Nanoarchaeota archaeon]
MLLTKSNYLLGLQCSKLLWVAKNDKQRIPEPDKIAQAKFTEGNIIGVLATKVFEQGIDLSGLDFNENLDKTKQALKERKPIFEAGFLVNDLFSRGDILFPAREDEWDIIEVKSATQVKEVNLYDVAFQKYVYEKAGLKIRNCILMHVNNQYVRDGGIEPSELFILADVTEKMVEFSEGIEERIKEMLELIKSKEKPKCAIGVYCSNPYDCALKDECWRGVPEESVFEFYRMFKKKCFELYSEGICCMKDVPEDIMLNDKQKIQRRLACDGGKHMDKLGIKNFLNNLKYPIYYLDFETINPVLPKFNGMKPYQRIPFQFSLHVQDKPNGDLKHVSFLAEGVSDPRPKFMQALKDNLADKGSILVYNQSFEKGVMNECSDALPEFKEWYEENILPRIKDLWDVFRNFYYYDPRQKESASIKYVLPAMSDLSYSDMEIGNGALASLEYERITYEENVSDKEKKKVRDALEKYCELDTLAEVEIVKGLGEVVEK